MPKQALYLAWRPLLFDDMVGQEHITRTLRNSLKTGRIRHAYLFSGPRGTGKTTTARLLAKAVNCRDADPEKRPCNVCAACVAVNEGRYLDLIEIDAATHTGVDDVRDLRDKIAFSPGEGQYKVYIIDEVHRFTGNAFDALLKTLEEPPDHAIFVLATTEIDKVPATIKSRCLPFEFRRVALQQVADRLEVIATSEGLHIDRAALEMIARHGTGSLRDSISLLDQIVTDPDEHITLDLAQQILGTASTEAVRDLVSALISQDTAAGLTVINQAVDAGSDPRQFGQQVVEHLRAILLTQTASAQLVEASQEEQAFYQEQAAHITRSNLLRALRAFNDAVNDYKGGWQPQLALELALMDSLRGPEEIYYAQQTTTAHAAPAPQPTPPAVPEASSSPDEPPVIPLTQIRAKWDAMLRVLNRLNKTAPAVVSQFQVVRVFGNVIVIGSEDVYVERLQHPEKMQVLERAFFEVHHTPLRVQLVRTARNPQTGDVTLPTDGEIDMDDPLFAAGRELGAEMQMLDDE